MIGITDNPNALLRWITAGPEIARIIEEFESTFQQQTKSTKHHDQSPSVQRQFAKHVMAMVSTFEECGNPFREDSKDLISLDTKEVMSDNAITSVKTIK